MINVIPFMEQRIVVKVLYRNVMCSNITYSSPHVCRTTEEYSFSFTFLISPSIIIN